MGYHLASMAAAAVLAVAVADHAAANERFSAAEIRQDIIGKRIYLAAPMGGEFPLNYRRNGQVDGNGKALGIGRLVQPKDTGSWWIKGDRLCQQFQTWYDGKPMCFELFRTGADTLKWIRNNGQVGTARIGGAL